MNNALTTTNGATSVQESTPTYTPRVDVLETDEELVFMADVPGVKPEDVDVRFENGELTLHARCQPCGERRWLVTEYGVGDFYRAFAVNEEIEADRITAELKHGVLTVRLPKSDAVKPRKITVKGE